MAADAPTVLYDGDCGLCKALLALLLRLDRGGRLRPVPIQSEIGERLLAEVPREERLRSWHLVTSDGAVHSGGAGIPAALAVLPAGRALARLTSLLPGPTSRAYEWVADHRSLLGRPLGPGARRWADRVIAERSGDPREI
jgi:predicted DCC family thiol-disulfide oxidoreductase YuxK